ncbi:MAG: hypothetical protein PHW24_03100 [Candidatus Moranbacteria bacterium]|nr:hypothetical protein [Candidatus Moranbacteria bacterium]
MRTGIFGKMAMFSVMLFSVVLLFGCGGGGGGGSSAAGTGSPGSPTPPPVAAAPVPDFSYTVDATGLVKFKDQSTGATRWFWEFKNSVSNVSSLQNPEFLYTSGTYSPTLTVYNSAGVSATKTLTITVTVITPPPTPSRLTLASVPAADLTDNVDVLINQSYVTLHPEVTNELGLVLSMINDVNSVIIKDSSNKKHFALSKIIPYPDSEFSTTRNNITGNPTYIRNNNSFVGNSNYTGSSLVLWYYTGAGGLSRDVLPKYFIDNGGGTAYAGYVVISGKTHGVSCIAMDGMGDYLLVQRDSAPKYVNGFSSHDASLRTVLHEAVGHGGGAGVPEQYSLNFTDSSGTLPSLNYDFNAKYPEDPMSGAGVVEYNILQSKFSPFNSWLILHNANHQLSTRQIADVTKTMTIQVKVVDLSGNPVVGATVISYGAVATSGGSWGIAKNMTGGPLETLTTGANGMVKMTNRIGTSWFVEGVKAYSGSKKGGSVLNSYDMQAAYWMQNLDEYVLTIVIQ